MKKTEGAKPKLLRYLKEHVGEQIPHATLKEVAENKSSWERSLRTLRDDGYILEYNKSTKCYCFPYAEPQNEPKDSRSINNKLRSMVILRDNSTCQMCGRNVKDDHIKIHIDHKVPLSWGGKTEMDNLQVLCSECNEGKKNYEASEDPELMIEVSKATSAKSRLKLYFEYYENTVIGTDKLSVVAKTRGWERALRYLRSDDDMDIEYIHKNQTREIDGYIYHNPRVNPNENQGL